MAKLVSPKRVPTCLNDFTDAEREIYTIYPRKRDHKFEGLRKIRRAIRDLGGDRDVATAHLKARVVAYAAKVERDGTEDAFILMCKTWMGQRCYLDEPKVVPEKPKRRVLLMKCNLCGRVADTREYRAVPGGYVCRTGCREESQQ